MKLHSNISSTSNFRERLSEVASLISVSIRRLEQRKKDKDIKILLDSCADPSITAACNKIRRYKQ